jgi:hypothetical protein
VAIRYQRVISPLRHNTGKMRLYGAICKLSVEWASNHCAIVLHSQPGGASRPHSGARRYPLWH